MGRVETNFKKTEIGLIPVDWEIQSLYEHFNIYAGGDAPKHSISQIQSEFHQYPIFANSLQGKGLYGYTSECRSKADSLTITARGHLGHAEYRNLPFFPIVRLLVLEPKGNLDAKFTAYLVNDRVRFPIENTGVPQLTAPQAGKVFVTFPPTKTEQTAIANALSDADGYIESLEKLIAKKQLIKQGAMQQLLSPKANWEVKKLGEVAEIYTGKKNNQDKVENGLYPFFVRSQAIERINSYSFEGEAILVPGEGNIGKIFHYIDGKFDYHQRVYKISDFKKGYFSKYIYRYISEYFGRHAMENSVKATVDSLRLPTFQVFEIPFPPTLEEQTRIATILSDIDLEIVNLTKKLTKAQNLKHGMMQQLLTGKIRLA